jgi:DNA-binding protein H-NS
MPRIASLKVLERKIKKLEKQRDQLANREKPGIKELKRVMVKYRLTRNDVDLVIGNTKRRKSKLAGRPLKPKYRNPTDKSQTWAGRGLRPKWVVDAMKKGGKLQDFAI